MGRLQPALDRVRRHFLLLEEIAQYAARCGERAAAGDPDERLPRSHAGHDEPGSRDAVLPQPPDQPLGLEADVLPEERGLDALIESSHEDVGAGDVGEDRGGNGLARREGGREGDGDARAPGMGGIPSRRLLDLTGSYRTSSRKLGLKLLSAPADRRNQRSRTFANRPQIELVRSVGAYIRSSAAGLSGS